MRARRGTQLVRLVLAAKDRYALLSLGTTEKIREDEDGFLNVEDEDVKRAYHRLARQIHPDKHPGCADAMRAFQALVRAYELCSNPESRAAESDDSREEDEAEEADVAAPPPVLPLPPPPPPPPVQEPLTSVRPPPPPMRQPPALQRSQLPKAKPTPRKPYFHWNSAAYNRLELAVKAQLAESKGKRPCWKDVLKHFNNDSESGLGTDALRKAYYNMGGPNYQTAYVSPTQGLKPKSLSEPLACFMLPLSLAGSLTPLL